MSSRGIPGDEIRESGRRDPAERLNPSPGSWLELFVPRGTGGIFAAGHSSVCTRERDCGERVGQDGSARLRRNGACRAATLKADSGGELRVLGHGRASKCGVGGGRDTDPAAAVVGGGARGAAADAGSGPYGGRACRARLVADDHSGHGGSAEHDDGFLAGVPHDVEQCGQHGGRDLGGAGCVGDPAGLESAPRCGVRAEQFGAAAAPGAARRATGGAGGGAGSRADTPPGREQPVRSWSTRPGEKLRSVVGRGVGSPGGLGGLRRR